jgi:hypothetical protein
VDYAKIIFIAYLSSGDISRGTKPETKATYYKSKQ